MLKTAWIALLALSACFMAVAAAPEDELRQAEKSWAAAVVARDYAGLERIYADQLIYAHSTGAIETKKEYIDRLRTGAQRYDAIDHEKMTVRLYADAAVVHAHVVMKGQSGDRPFNNRLMMLHLWVKQAGRWQLAAHQTTELK